MPGALGRCSGDAGTEAIASGLTRSEDVSPDDEVTFLPHPATSMSTAAQRDMTEMMFAQRFTGCPPLAGPLDSAPLKTVAGEMEYLFWTLKSTYFLTLWVGCIPSTFSLRYER